MKFERKKKKTTTNLTISTIYNNGRDMFNLLASNIQ